MNSGGHGPRPTGACRELGRDRWGLKSLAFNHTEPLPLSDLNFLSCKMGTGAGLPRCCRGCTRCLADADLRPSEWRLLLGLITDLLSAFSLIPSFQWGTES